jgi:hypothetical protein
VGRVFKSGMASRALGLVTRVRGDCAAACVARLKVDQG